MKPADYHLVAVGAGRMGRGIAHMFAYAGHDVTLLDIKSRSEDEFKELEASARAEIRDNLHFLSKMDVLKSDQVDQVLKRIHIRPSPDAKPILDRADYVLEGVPETKEAKTHALSIISQYARADAVVTSTTSTMLVTELQQLIKHPERFLNTHFLNPAFLIPLVEISAGPGTDEAVVNRTMDLFEGIGKVPVRCAPTAGYIIPRLQALLMSEACRMVEQGVASAEDIDKAIMNGFGPRYATMGVLEFVDWGGVDILYYAGHYLAQALKSPAHAPPVQVTKMMEQGHRGLREGQGYYDYRDQDVQAFQNEKLERFVTLLKSLGQVPKAGE